MQKNMKKYEITREDNPGRSHKEHVELLATGVPIELIAPCEFASRDRDIRGLAGAEIDF
jgi:hypothetical protein